MAEDKAVGPEAGSEKPKVFSEDAATNSSDLTPTEIKTESGSSDDFSLGTKNLQTLKEKMLRGPSVDDDATVQSPIKTESALDVKPEPEPSAVLNGSEVKDKTGDKKAEETPNSKSKSSSHGSARKTSTKRCNMRVQVSFDMALLT